MADTSTMLKTFLGLLLFALAVFLLLQLVRGFGFPHRQAAFANTELLRLSLDKACATKGTVVLEGFELPQNIPPDFAGVPVLGSFSFPGVFINTNGDPTYLLYYENFPAGEAIGWEVYTKPDIRLVIPGRLDEGEADTKALEKLEKQRLEIVEKAAALGNGVFLDNIVFANIVLQTKLPDSPVKQDDQDDLSELNTQGDVGIWQLKESQNFKFYQFNSYATLDSTEKALIKYRSCGQGNLCLKTNSGIYAFPLESCIAKKDEKTGKKEMKIQYIQLVYDVSTEEIFTGTVIKAGAETTLLAVLSKFKPLIQTAIRKLSFIGLKLIGGVLAGPISQGAATVVFWGSALIDAGALAKDASTLTLKMIYWEKTSDFYLASPCKTKGNVVIEYKENCFDDTYACKQMIKYPIYDVVNKNVVQTGEHYTCIENSGVPYKDDELNYDESKRVKDKACLRVKFESKKDDFCWTANSRRRSITDWTATLRTGGFTLDSGKLEDTSETDATLQPVGASTVYDKESDGTYLYDGEVNNALLDLQVSWYRFLADIITLPQKWTWPGQKAKQ